MSRHRWLSYGGAALGALAIFAGTVIYTARPTLFSDLVRGPQCQAASAIAEAVKPFARGQVAAFQPVTPSDVNALPFDGTGEDARTIEALNGRVTLLNLWATWCAPCRAEMPSLAALNAEKESDDFVVIATSIDDRDQNHPENFLAETGAEALDYYREPSLTLFNSLRSAGLAQGMPTTLLLGPDGCVAGVLSGAAPWDGPDAKKLVDAAVSAL
ncbi:TlpA disulfide reductase family protein [Acuticoccus sediminis]|uniref:TlpA disulfide reductase family protein n=1 Tax=Acuticoccus sediminis TaxID=2184697 RepID=UPI001CFD1E10|nr:TlpA disulfide reductase family protein [Acuticoccus sediminis]